MRRTGTLNAGLALGALLSCGGGGGPAQPAPSVHATRLIYVEPPATGWRFTKVAGTGTFADPLILELRGPSLPRVKGVAFILDLGSAPKATWAGLGPATCIAASPNLDLGSGPRLLKDRVTGTELQVGLFQKTGDADPGLGVVCLGLKVCANQGVGPVNVVQIPEKAVAVAADGTTLTPLAIMFGAIRAE